MLDFWVKCGILENNMQDVGRKWAIFEEKMCDFQFKCLHF